MENVDKQNIKLKLGITVQKIISANKALAEKEEGSTKEADSRVTSLRKLAAAAGIEFAIIQKISSGNKNAETTTLVGIAEGFGMNMQEFFSVFDTITEQEIFKEKEKRDKQNKNRRKRK